ncbi:eae-like domain protein [Salmonella enterica subsp. enterica]|nr:eae-like domain protein [Salmonella enterica]EDW4593536.1 eae-like domain protein [Salmonella enterica subsp. enterica]
MGSNIIELAKLGHERAAELKASCGAVDVRSLAQLISDLATQLEVQFVRSTNMAVQLANAESKCRELAAENEKRNTHSEALAVDNAALREVVERMVNQFAMSGISPEEKSINPAKSLMFDAKSALFMPATDAYLAEVRAQGVEMAACALDDVNQFNYANMLDELAQKLRKGGAA